MVEAMTPVKIAKIRRTPPGGSNRVSTDSTNQSSPNGIRNENIVWPMKLPLLLRSMRSFAARGG
jgi:hypothetical protein